MSTADHRFGRGFLWGVVATVVMSIPMLIATATGVSPLPEPIPAAISKKLLGAETAGPLVMIVAVVSHLGYGGIWSGLLASQVRPVTIGWGLGLGVGLWLLMQVAVLPFLGWGLFGSAITPAIAVGTLVLHLIYGATVGAGMDRSQVSSEVA